MTAYSLSSTICPVGASGHRIVVTAVAGGKNEREEIAIEIAASTYEAEHRRAELLALIETRLRERGHDVVDCYED